MSPERTCKDGWYRLDRRVAGVGRIRIKSGRSLAMHRRVDALVTKLAEQGRLEELRALKAGEITSMMLVDADRRNATATNQDAWKLAAGLWSTGAALFPSGRYHRSLVSLQRSGVLDASATVGDLTRVDWPALEEVWGHSAADWNHLRRAVSRLLTLHLGEHHAFRVALLKEFPRRVEEERLVEVSPAEFQAIIAPAPEPLRHIFWTLAATGLRPYSEFPKLTAADLWGHAVHVRLSKTPTGQRVVPVDPRLWPHVLASIPCPLRPDYLTRAWRVLADRTGRRDLVLRDLRHCYGFWSLEAGVSINVLRDAMGHRSITTTQRYVRQRAGRSHAGALADLLVPQVVPQARKGKKRA